MGTMKAGYVPSDGGHSPTAHLPAAAPEPRREHIVFRKAKHFEKNHMPSGWQLGFKPDEIRSLSTHPVS